MKESQIIEALLFSTKEPLSIGEIQKITGIKGIKKVRQILKELDDFYQKHDRSFTIEYIVNGYQLRTKEEYSKWIQKNKHVKQIQISNSAMETLSIIAYKQPLSRASIEAIRTVDCSYSLRSLLNKKLIKISGREETPGRPLLYSTSKYFLQMFGLKKLDELPKPEELQSEKPEINEPS